MARPICQSVSVLKLMLIQQVREEKKPHMKRNKPEAGGDALRIWAALQAAGPQPIAGPRGRGPRHSPRGVAALIESEPLLLMQRRCRTQHERSPSSTGTPRRDSSPSLQPLQALQRGWATVRLMARASSLLGFLPRQPSVTGPGFVRGRRVLEAVLRRGWRLLRSALWMPSFSSVIS